MTAYALPAYEFFGFTCAHRVKPGVVVCDDREWREVSEVLDERLNAGVPIMTLVTTGATLHLRPSARVLVCAHQAPDRCERHNTPEPFAFPPIPASQDPGGER